MINFPPESLSKVWRSLRLRLNLQSKLLLLVTVSMLAILFASSYLHTVRTRSLVERDHYENALNQTLVLTQRISLYDYFSSQEDLKQEMQLVAGSRPDFKEIDVYQNTSGGPVLLASTVPGATGLSTLAGASETYGTQPEVRAADVTRDNRDYWLITANIKNAQHNGFIQALVLKGARRALVSNLHREYNLMLFGAVAASVVLLYLVFNYFFHRPVKEILHAMNTSRGGALSTRAPVRHEDELGTIAREFNRLMDDIEVRSREREDLLAQISDLNNDLQKKVDRATCELRAANANLIRTQQQLACSERMAAVGQVTASLAHEIGTPLNAINGHLQLLGRKFSDTPEAQRRIKIIDAQLASVVQAVRSLLERTHRRKITMQLTDINAVIRELTALVEPMLESRRIKVTVALDQLMPKVMADRDSLNRVLLNLVNNSCDAMPDGGLLEISTRYQNDLKTVEVIVSDTGAGIPANVVGHLFEPMFTTKQSGSGLGLVIARDILTEHCGQIDLVSGNQAGATFRLTLPAIDSSRLAPETEAKANAA